MYSRKVGSVFHRDTLFNSAGKAWEKYKDNPGYFKFPERVTVEVTNRCNLSCVMCPRHKIKNMRPGEMDIKLFKRIIDEISEFLPVGLVPFFRGEPFLHPQFLKMLAYAAKKRIKPIQLATNAFFVGAKTAEKVLESGIDFISFSVDANNSQIYKKIRKNSDFEQVFSNIINFLELKKRKKLIAPEVQVSAVRTEKNEPFINEFVTFWKDKADRVRIYDAHSLDGRLGHVEGGEMTKQRKPCLKLLTDMVIYWNGEAAICNHDWQRDMFIGRVGMSSIKDIWNNSVYKKIREMHMRNELNNFAPCNYCSYWLAGYGKSLNLRESHAENKISSH